MDKKTFIEGIAVGAVAGAIATLLLAPHSGKETREELKAHLTEIKEKVAAELAAAGEFTRDSYDRVVNSVIAEFEAARKLTAREAGELRDRLKGGFEEVRTTAEKHAME